MTAWNATQLDTIGAAEELELRSERADGSLRAPVTMWVVRAGDDIYVRSVKGVEGPWYRGALVRHQGSVEAGGLHQDVAFDEAGPDAYDAVDAAYRTKYGRYTTIVGNVLTEQARVSTLRLEPR